MKAKHRETLVAIFSNLVKGTMEWAKIEALLVALGCKVIEATGSGITFEKR